MPQWNLIRLELARTPESIAMADVLRALEGPIAPMICASEDPTDHLCDRTARCTVNVLWLRIRDAITGTLESITLADLLPARPIALESTVRAVPGAPVPDAPAAVDSSVPGSAPGSTGLEPDVPAADRTPVTA